MCTNDSSYLVALATVTQNFAVETISGGDSIVKRSQLADFTPYDAMLTRENKGINVLK